MPGESHCRRFRSLLSSCDVFPVPVTSLCVCVGGGGGGGACVRACVGVGEAGVREWLSVCMRACPCLCASSKKN